MASSESISNLTPFKDTRFSQPILHYRNIPYATVSKRYEKPQQAPFPKSSLDCTTYGPQCHQIPVDNVHAYFSIPGKDTPAIKYDELKCTNLNVTLPAERTSKPLPVLVWIHGGAIMQAWPSAQHRLGDPGPLVAQATASGKPIILVTVNFRLNIFSFGTGEEGTEVNLMLYDQLAALKWVKEHISKFGGDPNRITVGGESAGAICIHALLTMGAKFQRAVLASGSLFTTPPQKDRDGFGLISLVEGDLQLIEFDKGNTSGNFTDQATMLGAKPETLLQCIRDLQIGRMWFWNELELGSWRDVSKAFGGLDGLMIGDCRDEAFYLKHVFTKISAKQIANCFATEDGHAIAKLYQITPDMSDDAARKAALDFIGDARFNAWPTHITKTLAADSASTKTYQYIYDQGNPWKKDECAHATDLISVFGGYDEDLAEEDRKVGQAVREKYISFVNGEEPWSSKEIYGFGPSGGLAELSDEQVQSRRRTKALETIRELGVGKVSGLWLKLYNSAASTLSDE